MLESLRKRSLKKFARDEQGSVTVQILFFSLLLFATTALVLDSGGTYSKHSQMQSFTDQMALAAASELDGNEDSIARATAAVFGVAGEDHYLSNLEYDAGRYEVETVMFFSNMSNSDLPQNNMSGSFFADERVATATAANNLRAEPTITYQGGSAAESSRAALYAVVKARDTASPSIASQFVEAFTFDTNIDVREGATGSENVTSVQYSNIDAYRQLQISAVSAASISQMRCADLTPLVFCNPWENETSSPLDVDPSDQNYTLKGRSLRFFAPNFADPVNGTFPQTTPRPGTESPAPWDINHQMFKMTNPVADASGVCNVQNIKKIASGEDYMQARDRCLMAKAQHDTVCFGEADQLQIKPAHGPDVLRAINTAFDIWLPPFDQVMADSSNITDAGMRYNQIFEPDMVATMPFEPADRHGNPATQVQDGVPDYLDSVANETTQEGAHYSPGPDYATLYGVTGNNMFVDPCHIATQASFVNGTSQPGRCATDFIGDHFETGPDSTQIESNIRTYWQDMYDVSGPAALDGNGNPFNPGFCGTSLENILPGLADFCEVSSVPTGIGVSGDIDTWYELYQRERALFSSIETDPGSDTRLPPDGVETGTADSRVAAWGDGTNGTPDYVSRYGLSGPNEPFVKQGPEDFYALSGNSSLFLSARERRRLRAPMVNCSAVATSANLQNDGSYNVGAENVRIVDVYLPLPATQFCGIDPVTNNAILSCPVDSQLETQLYIEMIQNVTNSTEVQQYTAHLVR